MKYHLQLLATLFLATAYQGYSLAAISPIVNTDHPLNYNVAEALSDIKPEINCTYDNVRHITTCTKPAYSYGCHVSKKPNLMIQYASNIPTIEEFRKTAADKGLSNCVDGYW